MKFGYTIVYVHDVKASLAFFERAFGLPEFDSSSPKKAIFEKLPTQPCGFEGDFPKCLVVARRWFL